MILELIFLICAALAAVLLFTAGVHVSEDKPINGSIIMLLSLFVAIRAILKLINLLS